MDNRAIGVFDSGVGGLTVVWALMQSMPAENIIYFGDTARVPYGSKSESSVLRFAEEDALFLLSKDVKAVVVACNTATAIALPTLEDKFDSTFFGVIGPGASRAVKTTQNGAIGVIGTMRTIASGAYETAIRALAPDVNVFSQACPLFVPLIEENWLEHEVARLVVREYLQPLVDKGIDTLVLGCTHYPLLAPVINECYPQLRLVDSAQSIADEVHTIFTENTLAAPSSNSSKRKISIYLSDYSESFQELGERILKRPLAEELFTVTLEELAAGV